MTKAVQKINLSPSRVIPFDKLVLSQSNVRRIKAGVSIEELAEGIARRDLLQSLSVRSMLDGDGTETGKFEIPAGGRRFQALSLLVKQKRLAKTTPIPCIVRDAGSDRRAVFVGGEAYEAAGGTMLHDLFQGDDGGWLEDPALLDRLVTEKLQAEAETVAVEGWK